MVGWPRRSVVRAARASQLSSQLCPQTIGCSQLLPPSCASQLSSRAASLWLFGQDVGRAVVQPTIGSPRGGTSWQAHAAVCQPAPGPTNHVLASCCPPSCASQLSSRAASLWLVEPRRSVVRALWHHLCLPAVPTAVLPAVPPASARHAGAHAGRAYGWLAQEVGCASCVPPSCAPTRRAPC